MSYAQGPGGGGASCPQATYRALARNVVDATIHVMLVAIG